MQPSPTERVEFVTELIGGLLKAGCTHEEVCRTVQAMADVLDAVNEAGIDPASFMKQAASKNAFLGWAGSKVPLAGIGAALGTLGTGAAQAVLGAGSSIAGAVASNAIPTMVLGPLALGAAGYGGGQLLSQLMDRPNEQIEETKRQELLSTLRQNARRLSVDRHRTPNEPAKPGKKKPGPLKLSQYATN